MVQSIKWEIMDNLVHLDIYLENDDDDTGLRISRQGCEHKCKVNSRLLFTYAKICATYSIFTLM